VLALPEDWLMGAFMALVLSLLVVFVLDRAAPPGRH
jgi:hypothetical protein